MKVLLTGATGYIGHELALKLADENYIVHALVRDPNSDKIPKHKNIIVFEGDLCNYESIQMAIKDCTYVFHTAAYTNLKCKDVDNFYKGNVVGTENIMKAALHSNIRKVVFTSTLSVYGPAYKQVLITESQPRLRSFANDYELTKTMSEEVVFDYVKKGLHCVILNLTRVYGPGLSTFSNGVHSLMNMISQNDFLIVPSRLQVVSNYVFITDVVDAHLQAIHNGKSGEKYIIGGENINYRQLFEEIKTLTNSHIKILKVNYTLIKRALLLSAIIQWFFGYNSSLTPKVLDSLFTNRCASSQKAELQLEYKITPFRIGLQRTINHYQNRQS